MTYAQFKPFCSCDPVREKLHEPMLCDASVLATDGRLLVRKPVMWSAPLRWKADESPLEPELAARLSYGVLSGANVDGVMRCVYVGRPAIPLSGITLPPARALTPCKACEEADCPHCRKQRRRQGLTEDDRLPEACDCPLCDGAGWECPETAPVAVLGAVFNPVYLRRMAALPGVMLWAGWTEGAPRTPREMALRFTFDGGGDGVLRAMNCPADKYPDFPNLTPEIERLE